jgi:hypothetical protein
LRGVGRQLPLCPHAGLLRIGAQLGLALGAFADPAFPRPEQSVWTRDKHRWLSVPTGITLHELNPSRR